MIVITVKVALIVAYIITIIIAIVIIGIDRWMHSTLTKWAYVYMVIHLIAICVWVVAKLIKQIVDNLEYPLIQIL